MRQARPHAWVTVIAVKPPSSAYLGAQAVVEADGSLHGWVGGGCVQSVVKATALRVIATGQAQRLRLSNSGDPMDDVDVQPMQCASNGDVELFIQPAAVTPRLRVYGNTPAARAAAWFAREVGFEALLDSAVAATGEFAATFGLPGDAAHVSALPAPESYALVATQGDGDEAALEDALQSPARGVLVVASRRKAERLRAAMRLRGIAEERLADMHAPAGPDIGATTPGEIALAAVTGLVALRHGRRESTAGGAGEETRAEPGKAGPPVQIATGYVNPVCGAQVDPSTALSSLTMEGQTHYFCCTGCREEFERHPGKYLAIGARMRLTETPKAGA
nr:XdhC family protein [Dyella sedimenti]